MYIHFFVAKLKNKKDENDILALILFLKEKGYNIVKYSFRFCAKKKKKKKKLHASRRFIFVVSVCRKLVAFNKENFLSTKHGFRLNAFNMCGPIKKNLFVVNERNFLEPPVTSSYGRVCPKRHFDQQPSSKNSDFLVTAYFFDSCGTPVVSSGVAMDNKNDLIGC